MSDTVSRLTNKLLGLSIAGGILLPADLHFNLKVTLLLENIRVSPNTLEYQ